MSASGAAGLAARTVAVDDPGDLLELLPGPEGRAWLRRGEGLVAWGTAARLPAPARAGQVRAAGRRVAEALAGIDADDPLGVPGSGPLALVSLPFADGGPDGVLAVPEIVIGRHAGRAWVTVVAEPGDPRLDAPVAQVERHAPPVAHDRVRYAGSTVGEVDWLAAVARAVDEIDAGAYAKVVLARDRFVWAREPFDPRLLLRRLADRFPDCFAFAVDGLVGASPELLIRREGRAVSSLVLAGSAPRGADADADEAAGQALLASAKDRAEHEHSVASVRAALEPWVDRVDADAAPWLLRLANVQHLATGVRGELAGEAATAQGDALTLAGALHPTAAVCGAPTPVAGEAIARLEGMDRGRYAGPVGWVDARGDGELAIALRCAEVGGARARLFAGAGVVAGSLPEAELEETRLKLRAMQSAFEG